MEDTGQNGETVRNETKLDRRQKKTRHAIYAAFEELMAQMHYRQVTVAQVIDRADIGRSTFYAHFETKDELLEDMCREMFDHIFEGVNEYCVTHAELRTVDLRGKLAHLLYHLRDSHSGVCGKLVREGEPHFTAYFERQLGVLFEKEMPSPPGQAPETLATGVAVAAFSRTVAWWFAHDAAHSPEDVARWFTNLMWR